MSGWQPIDSAPKDGMPILVSAAGEICVAAWTEGFKEGGWVGWVMGHGAVACEDDWYRVEPTHWMPLPEPPVSP